MKTGLDRKSFRNKWYEVRIHLHVHSRDFPAVFPLLLLHQWEQDGGCWNPGVGHSPPSTQHPQKHIGQSALRLHVRTQTLTYSTGGKKQHAF